MYAYLNLLFAICLFRKGPQDIPYSQALFRLSIVGYALVSYLLLHLSVTSLQALLQVSVEIVLVLIFSVVILSLTNKRPRFIQTASALLGTDAFVSCAALPVIATLSIDNNNLFAFFIMLALMVWHWIITAHILRHALEKPFSFAIGIAFLYIFSTYQIMGVLFPSISPTN